jgi:hypothetical protein
MNPGDKVVCVDDIFQDWVKATYTALPHEGVQYVVRANVGGVTHEGGSRRPSGVILLVGMINPVSRASGQEFGFQPKRFRLLEELKQEAQKKKECFV